MGPPVKPEDDGVWGRTGGCGHAPTYPSTPRHHPVYPGGLASKKKSFYRAPDGARLDCPDKPGNDGAVEVGEGRQ